MWSSYARRLLGLGLGTALTACGGDLTLPESGPPPDDRTPTSLLVFSGDSQQARVGQRLEDPLVVLVTDRSTRPVAGVPVIFDFQGIVPEGEVDQASVTTDEDGRASAEVRLGTSVGPHIIEARVVQPVTLVATFEVTALERGGRGGGGEGGGGGGGGDDDD